MDQTSRLSPHHVTQSCDQGTITTTISNIAEDHKILLGAPKKKQTFRHLKQLTADTIYMHNAHYSPSRTQQKGGKMIAYVHKVETTDRNHLGVAIRGDTWNAVGSAASIFDHTQHSLHKQCSKRLATQNKVLLANALRMICFFGSSLSDPFLISGISGMPPTDSTTSTFPLICNTPRPAGSIFNDKQRSSKHSADTYRCMPLPLLLAQQLLKTISIHTYSHSIAKPQTQDLTLTNTPAVQLGMHACLLATQGSPPYLLLSSPQRLQQFKQCREMPALQTPEASHVPAILLLSQQYAHTPFPHLLTSELH